MQTFDPISQTFLYSQNDITTRALFDFYIIVQYYLYYRIENNLKDSYQVNLVFIGWYLYYFLKKVSYKEGIVCRCIVAVQNLRVVNPRHLFNPWKQWAPNPLSVFVFSSQAVFFVLGTFSTISLMSGLCIISPNPCLACSNKLRVFASLNP